MAASLAAHIGEVFLLGDDITRWSDSDRKRFADLVPWLSHDFLPLNSADNLEAFFAHFRNSGRNYLAAYNLGGEREMMSFPIPLLEERALVRDLAAVTSHAGHIEEDRVSLSKIAPHICAVVELLDQSREETQ